MGDDDALRNDRSSLSGWRALLFRAMKRFEIDEAAYLGLPARRTTAVRVPVPFGERWMPVSREFQSTSR